MAPRPLAERLDSAVIYQIYPRSWQDSDGDGVGDLRGIRSRLRHVRDLGADAIWLSPINPSPQADFGYDVADYDGVEPTLGTLEDFAALRDEAEGLGLAVLLDLVPCHTSIEHPWFREHPEFYVWSDDIPNNWKAAFGGPAWSLDEQTGRYYLHSFFPQQPDLDWRNPEVRRRMGAVVGLWLERGAAGFRLDALDRLLKDETLRDDPPAKGPPALPLHPEHATLEHAHSRNDPGIGEPLAALREAAGEAALIGEVYLTAAERAPYLGALDAAFSFDLLHAEFRAESVRDAIEASIAVGKPAWVLSNHDFPRLPTRVGAANVRLAAMLLLTLPGPVFIFQGDEIGMTDGPGVDPPQDRHGRDPFRHPMQWDDSPSGGFTAGDPWLPAIDPALRNVVAQAEDHDSILWLYRDLIALRRSLGGPLVFAGSEPDTLVFTRGEHLVALNFADEPRAAPAHGEVLLRTGPAGAPGMLPPHAGMIARTA
jgi:alpha-glucosidase